MGQQHTQRYLGYALIAVVEVWRSWDRARYPNVPQMPRRTGPYCRLCETRSERESRVLVFSTSLWVSSPMIDYAGASLAWRFPLLWTLAGLYPQKPAADNPTPRIARARRWMYTNGTSSIL